MPLAPKQATLDRLAMALGCAVTDLLPGGNKSGTSPEYRVLTEKLTAQQEEICGLKEEIEEIGAERNQLRAIITDFFDASQPGVDDWRKSAAKTKFLSQATEIKHQEMMKAVGGIGDPII